MKIFSLYKTTNTINGKIYIGVHCETLWPQVDNYLGSGIALQNAITKYGKDNFKREILCISDSPSYIYELESKYVDKIFINEDSNYNLCRGGRGCSGHSDDTKRLMSENMLGERNHRFGQEVSEVTRNKRSAALKGKKRTDEQKQKLSDAKKGRKLSENHRSRISESKKGSGNPNFRKAPSAEWRERQRQVMKGRIWIHNPSTNENKRALPENIPDGWEIGRILKCLDG